MAKKSTKTISKTKKLAPSWDQLGKWIGQKIGKECENAPKPMMWTHYSCQSWPKKGHFCSALIFGVTLAWILNQQGLLLVGIPMWIQVILVAAFAFMMS